ncbi:CD44 antigen-like isoform X2 [Hemiscyllium ocellatum]|uniref:CD44 antigen-like isoform X2 n=1 Tax=Hemiscyllium ocellatum TaxID=170820 RepID=UPI002966D2DF|nr:CD44 antigen-like isoform X2 [Hemiscyllium ocellatum]
MFQHLLIGAVGSILVANSLCVQGVNSECRHQGIFQEESSSGRYQLNFLAGINLCQSLGTTLATLEQVKRAQRAGYETCRYGWIQGGLIAIPRVVGLPHCANNFRGVYTIQKPSNDTFDVFCFNATEYESCSPEISSPTQSPADPKVIRVSHDLTIHGKHTPSSLQTSRVIEHPATQAVKSRDVVTTATVAVESESPTLRPGPDESSPQGSSRLHIRSTVSPSGKSGATEKQQTRAVFNVTAGYTAELGMAYTVLGFVASNLPETTLPSLQKNTSVATNGSGYTGDMKLHNESNKETALKIKNQVTETKLERRSETDLTTVDSIAHSSPSALISDNPLEVNAMMLHTKVHKDASDFRLTSEDSLMLQTNTESGRKEVVGVTTTRSSETTQKPPVVGIHRVGTASMPVSPNSTEQPQETVAGTRLAHSEPVVNDRVNGEVPIPVSLFPTYLSTETGSISEMVSSESAQVHLDQVTVTALDARLTPSVVAPSDSPENGSTLEVLTTEVLREHSTDLSGHQRFSLTASPAPADLFTESGDGPTAMLRSETPRPTLRLSPNLTATTGIARISTIQPANPGSKWESHSAATGTVSQDVRVKPAPSVRPSGYLSKATTSSSTSVDHPTSQLSEMTLNDIPSNSKEKHNVKLMGPSSRRTTFLLRLMTTGLPHTIRTHEFGQSATSQTMINPITAAKPNSTDQITLDDRFGLKLQTPPTVGEKPPEASFDWLIVVGIIGSLLIIIFGGLLTAYSKRLCGRKKSLAITRPQDDNAAIMDNGNGRDLVDESGVKADIKRSDEWIQLMSKDNVEVVSESAEASRLMSGEESGEPSEREMLTATAAEEDRS